MDPKTDGLAPRRRFSRITDVAPDDLQALGAKALALDIDNTLAYDGTYTLFTGVLAWAAEMKAAGVPMAILSNTYPLRARRIAKRLGVPYVAHAEKPAAAGFLAAAGALGVPVSALAMAGDQLFTDVRGANAAGAIPLLVAPRHRELLRFFYYRRLRRKEREILAALDQNDQKQEK